MDHHKLLQLQQLARQIHVRNANHHVLLALEVLHKTVLHAYQDLYLIKHNAIIIQIASKFIKAICILFLFLCLF